MDGDGVPEVLDLATAIDRLQATETIYDHDLEDSIARELEEAERGSVPDLELGQQLTSTPARFVPENHPQHHLKADVIISIGAEGSPLASSSDASNLKRRRQPNNQSDTSSSSENSETVKLQGCTVKLSQVHLPQASLRLHSKPKRGRPPKWKDLPIPVVQHRTDSPVDKRGFNFGDDSFPKTLKGAQINVPSTSTSSSRCPSPPRPPCPPPSPRTSPPGPRGASAPALPRRHSLGQLPSLTLASEQIPLSPPSSRTRRLAANFSKPDTPTVDMAVTLEAIQAMIDSSTAATKAELATSTAATKSEILNTEGRLRTELNNIKNEVITECNSHAEKYTDEAIKKLEEKYNLQSIADQPSTRGNSSLTPIEDGCHRTAKIVGVPKADGETPVDLEGIVERFMKANMGLSDETIEMLRPFSCSRSVTSWTKKPIEVVFRTHDSRDFFMASQGFLNLERAANRETAWIQAKYPIHWLPLKKKLDNVCLEIRKISRVKEGRTTSCFHAQVRYTDDESRLTIWTRNVTDEKGWRQLSDTIADIGGNYPELAAALARPAN